MQPLDHVGEGLDLNAYFFLLRGSNVRGIKHHPGIIISANALLDPRQIE